MKSKRARGTTFLGAVLIASALGLTIWGVHYNLNPPAALQAFEEASPQVDLPTVETEPQQATEAPTDVETSEPVPVTPQEAAEQPETPTLAIPKLNLEIPIGALAVENNHITPPTFDKAYVVTDFSVPLSEATTGGLLIVVHSTRNGTGLGNKLFTQKTSEPTLTLGDTFTVDGNTYTVTDIYAEGKDTLKNRPSVWEPQPGQLHLVTCLQPPQGGASTQNFVIQAELV